MFQIGECLLLSADFRKLDSSNMSFPFLDRPLTARVVSGSGAHRKFRHYLLLRKSGHVHAHTNFPPLAIDCAIGGTVPDNVLSPEFSGKLFARATATEVHATGQVDQ